MTDAEGLKEYAAGVMDTVHGHGGKVIVRDPEPNGLEGDWDPKRVIIIEFADKAAAESWYNSDEYQALLKIRLACARGHAMIVDGV